MSDNGVAALAVFLIFGAPIGAFIVNRILAHRERIEMIRRGMMPPPQSYRNAKAWRNAGSPGMGMPGMGVPPQPGPAWQPSPSDQDAPDRSLRKGIMLALIGLAILIGLSFIGSDTSGPMNSFEIHPGPWLLGGLIPMFVGIAQIIVALLSGARLGPIGQAPDANYYRGQPQPPPDVHVYDAQPRPNASYEELRRPTPPPERR